MKSDECEVWDTNREKADWPVNMKAMLLFFFCVALPLVATGQNSRIRALCGMSYALEDKDNSLNLYDFGGNPAWLAMDEKQSWLKMAPTFSNVWGDYRRVYEPSRSVVYGAGFDGVKNLEEKGTFRGSAVYDVEKLRGVYRSVKRFPYAGEAFFLTDTTTGDITYNGPSVAFMYSYELFPQLLIGASMQYQILDGLKNIYSRTKTLYREVRAVVGVAYQPLENLAVGVTIGPADAQERIEAKSDELLDVEIFNYRGETYAFKLRGSTVDHKVKTSRRVFGSQVSWQPAKGLDVGFHTDYGIAGRSILVTRGIEKENEDGYASFESYNSALAGRYRTSEDLTVGFRFTYAGEKSWSKYSSRELTLWEWTTREWSAGAGFTYYILPGSLLLGGEYEYASTRADSSKYIDDRYVRLTAPHHIIRCGVEYGLSSKTTCRAGYVYDYWKSDLATGGEQVTSHGITAGVGIGLFEGAQLEADVGYRGSKPGAGWDASRTSFTSVVTLKISSF